MMFATFTAVLNSTEAPKFGKALTGVKMRASDLLACLFSRAWETQLRPVSFPAHLLRKSRRNPNFKYSTRVNLSFAGFYNV